MNTRVIIFDFDGTLADTREAIITAKQETARQLGLIIASEQEYASTIGLATKVGFHVIYPDLSDSMLDLCVSTYRKLFDEIREQHPPVYFPGTDKVLARLKEKNILCSIATSRNSCTLHEMLRSWKLNAWFSYILCAEDTVHLKPHPEPVLKTLEYFSCPPEQALVVGDMPVDIAMGKGAGACTCGVTYGNSDRDALLCAGADFIIDSIEELPDILE
ncbi:MAG: HAD-IA family hydrolase [Clostridia bacterium]|nr:HAD-IA family hydrolase [Clostridia bacterium]